MIYDETLSYEENLLQGPKFSGQFPKREMPESRSDFLDFLGHQVASPLGIPAGPLLDSRYIYFAARMGFDLLTYKTIRSVSWPAHQVPNIVFVKNGKDEKGEIALQTSRERPLSITNSFGMPSQDFQFLAEDLPKAKASLQDGQVLIVSVTGSKVKERSFFDDFIHTALFAKEHAADCIEANFSCPNVSSAHKAMYQDPQAVEQLSTALVKALGNMPLILKVGIYPNFELQRKIFCLAAKAGVRGICGINSKSYRVFTKTGDLALGEKRPTSGVCGALIQKEALEFVSRSRQIINEEKLDLKLIGVGGVLQAQDIDAFLDHGADFVQSAVGMMDNPLLAKDYFDLKKLSMSALSTAL